MGRRNLCGCPESLPALLSGTHSVASSNPQTLVIPTQASVHIVLILTGVKTMILWYLETNITNNSCITIYVAAYTSFTIY